MFEFGVDVVLYEMFMYGDSEFVELLELFNVYFW